MQRVLLSLWKGQIVSVRPARLMADILNEVAAAHRISIERIKSTDRHREITHARFEACWKMRQAGHTFPAIGMFLGGRDHTSALHATRRYEELALGNPRRS